MRDILFPATVVAFFALATVLVRACEWLVEQGDHERRGEHDLP